MKRLLLHGTKGTYFDNTFFVPRGNTVKLKINYWQKCNFHEDVSTCVISLERGRGTSGAELLYRSITFKLTEHQVINKLL